MAFAHLFEQYFSLLSKKQLSRPQTFLQLQQLLTSKEGIEETRQ